MLRTFLSDLIPLLDLIRKTIYTSAAGDELSIVVAAVQPKSNDV